MKKCPFCAEEIQDEAIKCKHCGEFLNGAVPPGPPTPKLPWYYSTSVVVIAVLSVGPFALPLVWWHPTWPKAVKIGITIGTLIITWIAVQSLVMGLKMIQQTMETMQGSGAF